MTRLPDEFRTNHRAASESLIAAVSATDLKTVEHELRKAVYFEDAAMKHISSRRQRALGIALNHAVDLIRAVAHAEFGEQ